MAIYMVHLKDKTSAGGTLNRTVKSRVGNFLRGFYNEVCMQDAARQAGYTSADVNWSPAVGTVREGEVLIYFVGSQQESLIRRLLPDAVLHSTTGSTAHGLPGGKLSEVYVAGCAADPHLARCLAVVAFHESMHNKLGPEIDVHADGGGGLAGRLTGSDF